MFIWEKQMYHHKCNINCLLLMPIEMICFSSRFLYIYINFTRSKYLAYHETFGKWKKNNLDWKDVVTFKSFCLSGGKVRYLVWKENSIGFISFDFQNNWQLQSVCEALYFEKFNHYFGVTMTDYLLWNHIHRVNC